MISEEADNINKREKMERIKEIFGVRSSNETVLENKHEEESSGPQWKREILGKKKIDPYAGIFTGICGNLEKLAEMTNTMEEMNADSGDSISWKEIGISAARARAVYKESAVRAVKSLLGIYSMPRDRRRYQESCSGYSKDGFEFHNGMAIMREIIQVMEKTGIEPRDLGVYNSYGDSYNGGVLRQILLNDIKSEISDLRKMVNSIRREEEKIEIENEIFDLARKAMEDWSFDSEELGLTQYEKRKAGQGE